MKKILLMVIPCLIGLSGCGESAQEKVARIKLQEKENKIYNIELENEYKSLFNLSRMQVTHCYSEKQMGAKNYEENMAALEFCEKKYPEPPTPEYKPVLD